MIQYRNKWCCRQCPIHVLLSFFSFCNFQYLYKYPQLLTCPCLQVLKYVVDCEKNSNSKLFDLWLKCDLRNILGRWSLYMILSYLFIDFKNQERPLNLVNPSYKVRHCLQTGNTKFLNMEHVVCECNSL